jgi:hypothetical protein
VNKYVSFWTIIFNFSAQIRLRVRVDSSRFFIFKRKMNIKTQRSSKVLPK